MANREGQYHIWVFLAALHPLGLNRFSTPACSVFSESFFLNRFPLALVSLREYFGFVRKEFYYYPFFNHFWTKVIAKKCKIFHQTEIHGVSGVTHPKK